jgi:uncharacterized integral membrane protein
MKNPEVSPTGNTHALSSALRFYERGRILYTAILAIILVLWFVFTWPHFRPALNLRDLGAFAILGLLANLCYSAAYLADIAMQQFLPQTAWRRFRQILWVIGTLFAIVLENYWIADEIYDDIKPGPATLIEGTKPMWTAHLASNMNFPAPLAVVGFLAAIVGLFLALSAVVIFWFARKPKFARIAAISIGAVTVVYFSLLFGFSAGSHETALARGQEKYFCEIDCHLAYSVVDVNAQPAGRYVVTLRTRFDETTTSPTRPKDAPLAPSPREVRLIDGTGHEYAPTAMQGTPLSTPLKPADSYTTKLEFNLPKGAKGLRLLINTVPAWPDKLVIGDENSLLHKKTYLSL